MREKVKKLWRALLRKVLLTQNLLRFFTFSPLFYLLFKCLLSLLTIYYLLLTALKNLTISPDLQGYLSGKPYIFPE